MKVGFLKLNYILFGLYTDDVDVDYSRFPREILHFKFVLAGVESTETIRGFKLLHPGVAFFQRFKMPGWDYLGHHARVYTSSFHGTYGSKEFLKSFNNSDLTPWPRMDLHIQFRKEIFSGFVTVILLTLIITASLSWQTTFRTDPSRLRSAEAQPRE